MYKLSNLAAEDFAAIYEYTLLNFGALQADIYTDDLSRTFQLLSGSPFPRSVALAGRTKKASRS
ncbi:type II toxin-antitoxin system RelE/ParE family toxin [Marinobacter sp. M3C]|jgi:toxin ParE1/3/4|uniref:type II toxin-antitoxin system RelE/ParE family toxin n=1 Tax=Marinobacter sp. M3C TaxID=2917715 RepID=UPI00200C9BF1|nr:type II toxin-antitoxin system RelE/ParE family toxin [Marinobacter sp. M3C]UQG60441.1 type II toxin-antitoxin system RelE/ParE family toxin [Marinobacter sp. M3C]